MTVGFESLIGKVTVLDPIHLRIEDYRIRLHGVTLATAGSPCGPEGGGDGCVAARDWLMANIHGQEVRCDGHRPAPTSPLIAVCSLKGQSINAEMVRAGLARAETSAYPSFVAEVAEARAKKIGLWRTMAPAGN
jgi:endonuclease YncB( thermonuclease family)